MDNKTLFIEAHKIARSTVESVGNYQIAFKLALAEVKEQETKKEVKTTQIVNVLKCVTLDNFLFAVCVVVICVVLFGGMGYFALSAGSTFASVFCFSMGAFLSGFTIWSVADLTKDNYNAYYKTPRAPRFA